jgi:hypothetical protein
MCAMFVGQRKTGNIARRWATGQSSVDDADDDYLLLLLKGPDAKGENLGEGSLQREAERERLMRQMEFEEADGIIGGGMPQLATTICCKAQLCPTVIDGDTENNNGNPPFRQISRQCPETRAHHHFSCWRNANRLFFGVDGHFIPHQNNNMCIL